MRFRILAPVAVLVAVRSAHAQTASDSAQVMKHVAEITGERLRSILMDSSGARFEARGALTTWPQAVYSAIRELYPETARPVYDSTYRTTISVGDPSFRGDTVDVITTMSQCNRARTRLTFFQNHEVLRFIRVAGNTWRHVTTGVRHADGVCGPRQPGPNAGEQTLQLAAEFCYSQTHSLRLCPTARSYWIHRPLTLSVRRSITCPCNRNILTLSNGCAPVLSGRLLCNCLARSLSAWQPAKWT